MGKTKVKLIKTPNREIDEDEGPICSIKLLQGGGERICGGVVASGARFYTKRAGYFTTESHARQKGLAEELSGGEDGVWVVTKKTSPRLLASAFFQPSLDTSRAAKDSGFEGLPTKKYSLQRWAAIFQGIEAEASKNIMLSPEGTKRANGED